MSEDNKTGDSAGSRPTVTEDSVPRLPRHVKFRFDQARDAWVVLAPEKVFMPDEIAVEILKRCNGSTTLRDIIDDLAKTFEAERDMVASDVVTMLQDLADKGIITP
jgi:pyrroloquinoline quinone biosynthesis protein D